ncbi:MAG: Hpt domain-containing protein [Chlorobi bacterium]|nr:Hpt domain-containing protein [Chlorobiota bacterium]
MPNQFKIINLTYLESISDGDNEIIKELINIFIEQVPEFYEGFDESFENRDWLKIASFAHKAKSSVLSMGMEELGNKDLKNLELVCKQMVLNEIENKVDISASELNEVEKIKKSFKGYEPERIEWVKKNCNVEKIKELIDKFNVTCKKAVKELNTVLEN